MNPRTAVILAYLAFTAILFAGAHRQEVAQNADGQRALAEMQDEIDELSARPHMPTFTMLGEPIEQIWAEAPSDGRSYCRISENDPWYPARDDGLCYAEDAQRSL